MITAQMHLDRLLAEFDSAVEPIVESEPAYRPVADAVRAEIADRRARLADETPVQTERAFRATVDLLVTYMMKNKASREAEFYDGMVHEKVRALEHVMKYCEVVPRSVEWKPDPFGLGAVVTPPAPDRALFVRAVEAFTATASSSDLETVASGGRIESIDEEQFAVAPELWEDLAHYFIESDGAGRDVVLTILGDSEVAQAVSQRKWIPKPVSAIASMALEVAQKNSTLEAA